MLGIKNNKKTSEGGRKFYTKTSEGGRKFYTNTEKSNRITGTPRVATAGRLLYWVRFFDENIYI